MNPYSQSNNNRSNQSNPNNNAYWSSRGEPSQTSGWRDHSQSDMDNRSNQMNPNNEAYHSSRGGKGGGGKSGRK